MLYTKKALSYRLFCFIMIFTFIAVFFFGDILNQHTAEASVADLPAPAQMVGVSADVLSYPILKGLRINPDSPMDFEFIVDGQEDNNVTNAEIDLLIKYFLTALTIPQDALWVNLSPYEQDRVIIDSLGETDLGRDLLRQDYILKQLSASLTHPDTPLGRAYWSTGESRLENKSESFNKIWIVPEDAEVYENELTAFVTKAALNLLTEKDYSAMQKNDSTVQKDLIYSQNKTSLNVLLPEIKKDVNYGENFIPLRQIYNSVILGLWFKEKFKESMFKHYINQKKTDGIDINDKDAKEKIWQLYADAFKKGVYDLNKKEIDPISNQIIKRHYFSGGTNLNTKISNKGVKTSCSAISPIKVKAHLFSSARENAEVASTPRDRGPNLTNINIGKGKLVSSSLDDDASQDRINTEKYLLWEKLSKISKGPEEHMTLVYLLKEYLLSGIVPGLLSFDDLRSEVFNAGLLRSPDDGYFLYALNDADNCIYYDIAASRAGNDVQLIKILAGLLIENKKIPESIGPHKKEFAESEAKFIFEKNKGYFLPLQVVRPPVPMYLHEMYDHKSIREMEQDALYYLAQDMNALKQRSGIFVDGNELSHLIKKHLHNAQYEGKRLLKKKDFKQTMLDSGIISGVDESSDQKFFDEVYLNAQYFMYYDQAKEKGEGVPVLIKKNIMELLLTNNLADNSNCRKLASEVYYMFNKKPDLKLVEQSSSLNEINTGGVNLNQMNISSAAGSSHIKFNFSGVDLSLCSGLTFKIFYRSDMTQEEFKTEV